MADESAETAEAPRPRARMRKRPRFTFDKPAVLDRILKFKTDDESERSDDIELRLQRYAKLRMWRSGKDWPWPDASDFPLPDMMEQSQRTQDTLANAVMTQRPPIRAQAAAKDHEQKAETIDKLIDYQVFVEQPGETIIGDLVDAFTNDGVFTAFIPWVRERRDIVDARTYPPVRDGMDPPEHFRAIVASHFAKSGETWLPSKDGWDWEADSEQGKKKLGFYTKESGEIEAVWRANAVTYDGPRIIVKDYEDVLFPARAANLQIPGPSNPGGAAHVILKDYPTIDEIRRLRKSGFYDQLTDEDMEALQTGADTTIPDDAKAQKDVFQGNAPPKQPDKQAASHRQLVRLMCFDCYDVDGDGIDEDVIWWALESPKVMLKAKILTEMYPGIPPRRPFGEAAYLPVRGRRVGISQLELVETLHDAGKALIDQTIDGGTISIAPPWFYRPASTMKPEVIRWSPGEGYPLANPREDVHVPNFQINTAFGMNMLAILQQMQDRLTMQGGLQHGQVPAGRSSALRTSFNMASVIGQGEARPERILRRFFIGLAQIWEMIHRLNEHFLPEQKKIRIQGTIEKDADPYLTIASRDAITGTYNFEFKASVFNASKMALEEGLREMIGMYVNPMALQMGLIDADGVYRLFRDYGHAKGQDPAEYLTAPSPDANLPKILAEEALATINAGGVPVGVPAEPGGSMEHLEKLLEFEKDERFGLLDPNEVVIFKQYLADTAERAARERQQQAMMQAAAQFAQQRNQGQPGAPVQNGQAPDMGMPQISGGNEMLDETLPSNGRAQ